MLALILGNRQSLSIAEMPRPKASETDAVLRVTHCAVCRTDAKMWARGHRDLILPRVPGHEICGEASESAGRFVVWPGDACGTCVYCMNGAENLCRKMRITGFHRDGGFAEYVAVPRRSLIPVPDALPSEIACLAEPLACGLNSIEQAGVEAGQGVLIYGAGPVGLLTGLAVVARGGTAVIREIDPSRGEKVLEMARFAEIRLFSGDEGGFDAAINAAPSTETVIDGIHRLKPGGLFCLFSGLTDERPLPTAVLNEVHYRQLSLTGAYGCTYDQTVAALDILARHHDAARLLIEAEIPLRKVAESLPRILESRSYKLIVRPDVA